MTSGGLTVSDIYVARADGSHAVRITHSGTHDTQPAWSPDGKRLAYVSMPAGTSGNFRIVTVNSDGSNSHVVVDGSTTVQNPAWAPDGTQILFQSRNGLHQQLALVPVNGGAVRWLSGTIDANEPSWGRSSAIVYDRSDGALVLTNASGSKPVVMPLSGSEPALSPDGSRIAYVRSAGGAAQVFIAHTDGSHAVNVTQLASQDASHPAWRSNDQLLFTAAGRPQGVYTSMGQTYSMDAIIISSLITMALVLLLVRRWRMPLGAFTVLFALNGVALATQSDTYWDIPAALATGILADLLVALLKERVRSGNGFYTFAFIVPFAMTVFYIASVRLTDGSLGWPPNMIIGAPFIAGFAGLLVSFCYAAPLPQAVPAHDEAVTAPVRQTDGFTAEAATS